MKTMLLHGIFMFLGVICFITPQCFAMQMSQPIRLGYAFSSTVLPVTLTSVEGASYITLEEFYRKRRCVKQGGAAKFGDGKDALWFHYLGSRRAAIGEQNVQKALMLGKNGDIEETQIYIYKISTDCGITLYAISGLADTFCDWTVVGYIGKNTFVKYFDTQDITKKYFGKMYGHYRKFYYYGNFDHIRGKVQPFEVHGDTIFMNVVQTDQTNPHALATGQFRFKWDDTAKWFGIEYVPFR